MTRKENNRLVAVKNIIMDINDVNMREFGPITSMDMAQGIMEVAEDKGNGKIADIAKRVFTYKRCSEKQAWCMAYFAVAECCIEAFAHDIDTNPYHI